MVEAAAAARPRGVSLLADSLQCEGRSLLKSFVSRAVLRGESVRVLALEVSPEEFVCGLDEEVRGRLQIDDGFTDPLCWGGGDPSPLERFVSGQLEGPGPQVLVLDSLSWLLLRLGPVAVCQQLRQLQRGARHTGLRVLGLLHADLHPPRLLEVVGQSASALVTLTTDPRPPRLGHVCPPHAIATTRITGPSGRVTRTVEYVTVDEGLRFRVSGEGLGPERGPRGDVSSVDPAANLTFNLRVTAEERRAREGLVLPFHLPPARKASLLQAAGGGGRIFYTPDTGDDFDPEDPDDDLDI